MIKLEIKIEGMNIPKVEYEIYYPLDNQNFTKLNLSLCKDTKIDILIPVPITEDISKYDPNKDYYNDICTKAKSKNGTDITLKDRKNEFIDNNMTLCEEDCELVDYDYSKEKAKCSCFVKIESPLMEEIKFDKKKLLKRFIDINSISNLNVMKCYKVVFDKSILYNIGFFILIVIIMMYFICLIIFLRISFLILKNDITNILFSLKMKNQNKSNKPKNIRQNLLELDVIKIGQLNTIYTNHIMNLSIMDSNNKLERDKSNTMILDIPNKTDFSKKILEYKDFELNDMKYDDALKFDKRSFINYYFGLLRINHLFMFSFSTDKDYNSRIIKIFLFFFFFTVHLNINALFFNDDTMHKIYVDEGYYNFIYQLPQIIYSSVISIIINNLIKFLSLSQSKIVSFKQEKLKKGLDLKYKKLKSTLKIKFTIFFVITCIILMFVLFYISCFCGIYENTQIHLINDSVISFITSMISPLGICLLPRIIRQYSLRNKKPYLYKFSKILQMI